MHLTFTVDNITYSKFVKDEEMRKIYLGINEIIKAKLDGGNIEHIGTDGKKTVFKASEIQAIGIEFD
ncbi:MAG: hypothetical protein ACLSAJ_04025 [Intestinibacter bartlettii]|uniref:hypothetical protein n=1 Tax=Intestinibacter bartlettii TaxID=261299 RepID=UPI00399F0A2A